MKKVARDTEMHWDIKCQYFKVMRPIILGIESHDHVKHFINEMQNQYEYSYVY